MPDEIVGFVTVILPTDEWTVAGVSIQPQTPSGLLLAPRAAKWREPTADDILLLMDAAAESAICEVGFPNPDNPRQVAWVPYVPGGPVRLRLRPRPAQGETTLPRAPLIVGP